MNTQVIKGAGFGLTSGIITTLGLMVGLYSGTNSRIIVLGGILTIAIADSFSDALGIHISEEAERHHTAKQVWVATAVTFLAKLVFTMMFTIPVLLLSLKNAIFASIILGLTILAMISYWMAKEAKEKPWKVITEHITIAVLVVVLTNMIGNWIGKIFV